MHCLVYAGGGTVCFAATHICQRCADGLAGDRRRTRRGQAGQPAGQRARHLGVAVRLHWRQHAGGNVLDRKVEALNRVLPKGYTAEKEEAGRDCRLWEYSCFYR